MNLTIGATQMTDNNDRIRVLAEELREKDSEIENLKDKINTLENKLDELTSMIRDLYHAV